MRVYDYQCPNCNHIQESFVRDETTEVLCDKCQTLSNRLISTPCFILKGVGITSNGSFKRAKEGPHLDPELLRMPEKEFNQEMGTPGLYE